MMMSSPFLFGHQTGANYDWDNIASLQDNAKMDTQFQSGDNSRGSSEVVAQIGSNTYETLQAAVDAAENGDVIEVISDVILTETLNIPNGKIITLDLNGKVVSKTFTENKADDLIVNKGSLVITDNTETKTGKVTYKYTGQPDSNYTYDNATIQNEGTLTILAGIVENTTQKMSHASYAINTNAGATLNIEGGKVLNLNGHAIRMVSFGTAQNTVNVSGGYIEGTRALQVQLPGSASSPSKPAMDINISGGELKSNEDTYNLAIYVYSNGQSAENLINLEISGDVIINGNVALNAAATNTMQANTAIVSGGTINGAYGIFSYADDNDHTQSVIEITGGTFATGYSAWYAEDDGYIFVETGDGTYGVVEEGSVAQIVGGQGYPTLAGAFGAVENGETIIMLADVEVDESLNNTKNITLDLNGKTIAGTDNTTSNFGLIHNTAELTITDNSAAKGGKITLTATNDTGFNRYSSVVSNNPGGKLTVDAGTLQHLGGTYMSYAIDNLTNGKGTYAETIITGGTIESAYIGIRQFLNGIEATNKLTISGGSINGNNSAIYFQSPSANANTGEIIIDSETPIINKRIYMGATAGATEWPVIINIKASALAEGVEIVTSNLPEGYAVVLENGFYGVVYEVAQIGETKYTSLQAAIDAAEEGQTVKVIRDINLTQTVTVAEGKDVILDLNGKDINVANDQVNFNINGKLTLNDETGEGVFTSRNHFVNEGAEFIVNAGTVQNVATAEGGFPINLNGGSVTINGGTVQAVNNANYAIGGNGGTLVINGGTVKGNWGAVNLQSGNAIIKDGTLEVTGTTGGHALYVAGDTQVTIEGGEFKPYNGGVASYALVLDAGNPTVNVSGGMFHKGWGCVIVYAGNLSLTGGTFGSNMVITNNNPLELNTYCAEGYAALPDLNGNFIVGTKPTATVNNLGRMTIPGGGYIAYGGGNNTEDMPLSFVMQFLADQNAEDMETSPFADWYADFVITFTGIDGKDDTDLENNNFLAEGCYLAGYYGDFGWVKVPVEGILTHIENGVRYPVMLGFGMGQTYDYICSVVKDFRCALYLTPEILEANPNIQVNLELAIVDNTQGADAATTALVENENVYEVVDYDYDAIDFNDDYFARIGDTGYETLQKAINNVQNNQVIELLTHNSENIVAGNENQKPFNKIFTIDGGNFNVTGKWIFGRDDHNTDNSEITVKNVNFSVYGIKIDDFKSVTINECTFKNITEGNGIYVAADEFTSSIIVENCEIEDVAGAGINLRNPVNTTITGNSIKNTGDNAITFQHGTAYTEAENGTYIITNNVLENWAYNATEGRAIRIATGVEPRAMTIENNAMIKENAPEQFVKITGNTENVSIDKNYWNGANPVGNYTPAYYLVEGEGITPNSYYQNYSVENGLENLLPTQASVAQIGDYFYTTLEAAFDAVQNGETIIMIADAELETTITIPVEKTVILNLNGKKIAYTSTTQNEAMITNRGNLTINDGDSKDEMGEIYYNYIGAADPLHGKGNYTISNVGTLTVNGGKIHIAKLSQHAKYPIDNNSGSGDAILVINGGHLYNYNTSAIRQFCNSTTNKNSVTINGGLIEGYSAIWMQNPGKNTVNGQLTINAGEIRTTAKAYVEGTSPISEVASKIYCTIDGEGGAWDEGSALIIEGGIINENVRLNNETPASVTLKKEATYNGSIKLYDGGQFVHNGLMNVKLSKDITGTSTDGWYTISSPVGTVNHTEVEGLLTDNTHDLYRYNEETMMWENVKNNEHTDFTTLEAGRGYLYANTAETTLSFTGDLLTAAVEQNITATDNNLKGFNLIGNPFTHDITLDHISGASLAEGFYTLTNEGAWNANNSTTGVINALQGALIKTTETNEVQINPTRAASKSRSVNNGQLEINVSNANYNDVAYVTFNKGIGLDKIEHRNANIPMVYVPVNGTNYAVAIMSQDVTEIPVSFVAKTMGEYTISVEAQDCEFAQMYLIDKMTGYSTNLLLEDYTFIATSKDNADRFIIRLVNSFDHSFGAENFIIFNDEEMMINDIQGEGVIRIVDVLGRPVAEYNVFGSANISTTSFRSGAYMIQVIDESGVKVQKIIID